MQNHCFISWSYIDVGSATAHYEYCLALSENGHNVTLIARGEDQFIQINPNFRLLLIKNTFSLEKLSHLGFYFTITKHLIKHRYDFVDVFLAPGVSVLPIILSLKKTIWVLHIRTAYVRNGLVGKLKNLFGRMEAIFFDEITIINKGIAKNLYFGDKSISRMLELPLGVNPVVFSTSTGKTELLDKGILERTVFIHVGKMDGTRNLHKLIAAFVLVNKQIDNCALIFVGDGNDVPTLKSIIKKHRLEDKVIFAGRVPYSEVPKFIATAYIALSYIPINPIYDNQPPLKTLEYRQMGIPQVATNTSANRKLIQNRHNGLICNDDPVDYAQGILSLLKDSDLYSKIMLNSVVGMEKYYWKNIVIDTLMPFYHSKFGKK